MRIPLVRIPFAGIPLVRIPFAGIPLVGIPLAVIPACFHLLLEYDRYVLKKLALDLRIIRCQFDTDLMQHLLEDLLSFLC